MIEKFLDTNGMEKLSAAMGRPVDEQMLRYYARKGHLPHRKFSGRLMVETRNFIEFIGKLEKGPLGKMGRPHKRKTGLRD